MSYDFGVFTADSVAGAAWAAGRYDLACAGTRGPVPARLAAFASDPELPEQILTYPDALGVVINSPWPDARATLALLLAMTRDRELALYDPQLGRLFNPTGSVAVEVTFGDGTAVPYLTTSLLEDLLERPDPDDPFLVLARGDHHYIQTVCGKDGEQILEYRAGGPEHHYACSTNELAVAGAVMWDWAQGGAYWPAALDWQRVDV